MTKGIFSAPSTWTTRWWWAAPELELSNCGIFRSSSTCRWKYFPFEKLLKWFSSFFRTVGSSSLWGKSTWRGSSTTPSRRSTSAPTLTLSSLQSKIFSNNSWVTPCHQVWGEEEEGQGEDSRGLLELTFKEGSRKMIFSTKVLTPCQLPCVIFKPSDPTVIKLSVTYRSVLLHTFVFFLKNIFHF